MNWVTLFLGLSIIFQVWAIIEQNKAIQLYRQSREGYEVKE